MSKYARLGERLREHPAPEVAMSFDEIESVLGFPLPPSARRHRAFWSNNPENNVMTRAWRDAGFRAAKVDLTGGSLVFVREGKEDAMEMKETANPYVQPGGEMTTRVRHPVIGCMKGTVTILPGIDLTEPADPEWGRRAYGGDE
ncbi:DUF7662 domain-containing protein [Rubrimonas sp.]|uniref:DUF7662 domain-containing protein n=1 Tax=Rubrimonas sp. TaxID=2036015 RepID=UPI003FA6AA72